MKSKTLVCLHIVFIFALIPIATADWPMFHAGPTHEGIGTGAPVYSLTLLWNFTTGDNVNSSPAVVDGVVYVTSYDGYIYALNATTGFQLWKYSPGRMPMGSSPAVVNGVVYIEGGERRVYALNASDGTSVWSFEIHDDFASSPTVADGIVYIGTGSNYQPVDFFALNGTTGVQLWNFTAPNGAQEGSPGVANGAVYFGAKNGCVYALNATNGAQIWKYAACSGAISVSSPAIVNNVVYIALSGFELNTYTLYAFNANTGEKLWSYTTGGSSQNYLTTSAAVANGVVYICSRDGDVYAFNSVTGAKLWQVTIGTWLFSSPAVVDDVLYLGSGDGNVYAVDCTTGAILSNYTINNTPGRWVYSSPAVVNGVVYIGSCDHNLYALNGSFLRQPTITPTPKPTAPPTQTPAPTSTTTQTSTPKPTTSPTPKPSPSPNPTPNPASNTSIQASKTNGEKVNLSIEGNITGSQMAGATIKVNESKSTIVLEFTLTGRVGIAGFSNLTLPKNVVQYGTTPVIYIDGQKAQSQGYSQDDDNYYVWFTTHFSTHKVAIVFAIETPDSEFPLWGYGAIAILVLAAVAVLVVAYKKNLPHTRFC